MTVFNIIFIFALFFLFTKCLANPYCSLFCNFGVKIEPNYLCTLFDSKPENKYCQLINMTEEVRMDIVNYFNHKRNEFALGHEQGYDGCSNMQILNYDMELEFLARAEGRFCDNSDKTNTPGCLRTQYLYVDYIHTALIYDSKDDLFSGSNAVSKQMIHTFENWWKWPYDKDPLTQTYTHKTRDFKAALMVWAQLDYIGCAMFKSPTTQGKYDLSIDCVCMFGSKDTRPRTLAEAIWEDGYPCTKCPKGTSCETDEYKGLCGRLSTLKESHYRWQSVFWKSIKSDQLGIGGGSINYLSKTH